jgi:nicotinate-nucleotide adenylyltransferase
MMSARRVGIMGGTFDPIHRGHRDLALAAESALELTDLLIVPASVPPHRPQPVASGYHRFAMAALAVLERPHWRVSDVELRSTAPSYTSATLRRLHADGYSASELFFLIGADAFAEIETWKDYPGILDAAHFAVVSRPGWHVDDLAVRLPLVARRLTRPPFIVRAGAPPAVIFVDAVTADVSSTAIRGRRATGQPIVHLVDPRVEQHIERHGLYTPPPDGERGDDRPLDAAAGRMHG